MTIPTPDLSTTPSGKKPVIILAGPTASGKSALGINWANDLNGVIINADSQQIYRELRILSARPSIEEEEQAPHRLYGFHPITEHYSVDHWRKAALKEIDEAHNNGRIPILLGGTGFYFKALMEGLSPIPETPHHVREEVTALHESLGAAEFHKELAKIDPKAAERLEPNDRQRCIHAWEVHEHTGKTLTHWQSQPLEGARDDLFYHVFALVPDREKLYEKINIRFDLMMEGGAMAEVKEVHALDPDPLMPGLKAHGLPPLREYLEGKIEWEDAVDLAKQQTRNYAKRQLTWIRNQLPDQTQSEQMTIQHLEI